MFKDIYLEQYFKINLTTTKKGNHVLNSFNKEILVLDKMGNKVNPIFTNKEDGLTLYPSKPGTFVIYKISKEKAVMFQIVKILRTTLESYEDYKIKDVPAEAITYEAVCYMLNEYSPYEETGELMWEYPIIDRVEGEVDEFVFLTH